MEGKEAQEGSQTGKIGQVKRNESLQVAKNNCSRNKSTIKLKNGRVNKELCVGNF